MRAVAARCAGMSAVAVVLLAACADGPPVLRAPSGSSAPVTTAAPESVVSGRFVASGGAAPGATVPLSGTITVRRGGEIVVDGAATAGRFSLRLAPGVYEITGSSPQFMINDRPHPCGSHPVMTVVNAPDVRVDLICPMR